MKQESATNAQVFEADREITRDLTAAAGKAGDLLQDLGSQALESARETLDEARTAVRRQARDTRTVVGGYVNAHPWRFIGAAAAAGVVAGVLLGRR